MCGLCGVVELDRPPERATVEGWLDELAHRGPDGRGVFADDGVCLGHLRLAIIDLSDAGLQPMADGELQLLHNGEIYNYVELRDELQARGHRFSTATDSEVILRAYREWGESCVEHFNGMWAFVIWDSARRRLFASRDHFGIKPFYYRVDGGRFAFASEPWVLRRAGANLAAVYDYLEQGYLDQGESTFFSGVVRLPPAHSLTFVAEAKARRKAAPGLAKAVESRLQELALAGAHFDVTVAGPNPADEVEFLLGPNPGEPLLPLSKTASGGELARAMLAVRLVLTQGPPTLVFDEVDAGVGGEAAVAVGRALASVADHHQVLVVTHLPQVAAFAHEQVAVAKEEKDGRTVASAQVVREGERVVELSRMLSGHAASSAARDHAEELLAAASRQREN